MKIKNFVLHGLIAFCLLGMTSCNAVRPDTNPPSTGGDSTTDSTPNQPQYDLVKIDDLIKIGQDLENNTEITEKYYCKGIIEKIDNPSKNAITFKDETGSIFIHSKELGAKIQKGLKGAVSSISDNNQTICNDNGLAK